MAEKNYLKALKFLKKAYACPDGKKDIDLILDLAFLYDKIADFNSAEKMYKMALDIDNTCAIAYYGLGRMLMMNLVIRRKLLKTIKRYLS